MLQATSGNTAGKIALLAKRVSEPKPPLPSKRKRDTICGLGTFTTSFTIKTCPESPYDNPYTFRPVRIIGRSQLPLSFLDTSCEEDLTPNRLFSAQIDILENQRESHDKEYDSPKVLIARYETSKALYAIERVQTRTYSLCKLANWLKEREVAEMWDPDYLSAYPSLCNSNHAGSVEGGWWKLAVVDATQARPQKRIRTSMLRPHLQPQSQSQPMESRISKRVTDSAIVGSEQLEPRSVGFVPEAVGTPPQHTPQEKLEALVGQYLDAIYMSKTSLAYLAKGPITRIRTTFTSSEGGAPPTSELVTFLRSMLLSHKAGEKKYREKLVEVIKAIPPSCFSDEDVADAPPVKPKKSKRKVKLSREGMYPQEADIVKKWWVRELPGAEGHGEETAESRIRRRLADLRVRETLAQMIIILEIFALEALSTYKGPPDDEINPVEDTQSQVDSQAKPRKRKKKAESMDLVLDLLLDKLCIWQSVEQEGVLDFETKPSKQDDGAGSAGQRGQNDRLQSFCVEVIIPFYMNRLPEQARMVNRKLGGPANPSIPKRRVMKPPATSHKPGEPKEPEAKKSRRSLGRVATDSTGQTGHQQVVPSLSRSATDSALMNYVKREGSELPMSAIPFQRSPSNAARQSMSQIKLLKGRQIDLTTASATATAKLKQRKRVEDDLKEAIAALKKPNRGLAAGGYADEVENRGLGSSTKSKKAANPIRKIIKDVQVTATPRAVRRSKHVVEQTPAHQHNPFIRTSETDAPRSDDFHVLSSGAHPASSIVPGTVQRSAIARISARPGVAETPSKPPNSKSFLASVTANRTIFATPIKGRVPFAASPTQGVDATPTKAIASSPPDNASAIPRTLFATPTKNTIHAQVAESPLPAVPNSHRDKEEPSIFDALGWNDDDDYV